MCIHLEVLGRKSPAGDGVEAQDEVGAAAAHLDAVVAELPGPRPAEEGCHAPFAPYKVPYTKPIRDGDCEGHLGGPRLAQVDTTILHCH